MTPEIAHRPSPNHGPRPGGGVSLLVLHYTGMTTAEAALERLCDPASQVSAHYLIDDDGRTVQLVPEDGRAWHAGVSSWRGETDVNGISIGIELANPGHEFGPAAYPEAQMEALKSLAKAIVARHGIAGRHVVGHSDVAPGRKQDPGEWFDWAGMARAGIGLWPEPAASRGRPLRLGDSGEDVGRFQAALATYGYGLVADGRFGAATRLVVEAFQRHFRPRLIDGVADRETLDRLAGLLQLLD
jgi:N-acetylmuramoyl-L-alanine amidase